MGYTYRTSGPWGPGKGSNLTPAEVDGNFWQAVTDIIAKAPMGVGISNMVISGDQLTVVLTDHTLLGPYTLPKTTLQFRGPWSPSIQYYANDIITAGGVTYIVLINHISATTFDPGANDGAGNDFYAVLLSHPEAILPAGGAVGEFLRKASTTDFAVQWAPAALEDLSDVSLPLLPNEGDKLTYSHGTWTNIGEGGGFNLADAADAAIIAPAAGEPLVYDGTQWVNAVTVDLPCGNPRSVSGAVTIDRANGESQRLSVVGDITSLSFTGWPPDGQMARLVLEVVNTGSYVLPNLETTYYWPSGVPPTLTPNGTDIYIFLTFDGGSTVYGNVVGQNYI